MRTVLIKFECIRVEDARPHPQTASRDEGNGLRLARSGRWGFHPHGPLPSGRTQRRVWHARQQHCLKPESRALNLVSRSGDCVGGGGRLEFRVRERRGCGGMSCRGGTPVLRLRLLLHSARSVGVTPRGRSAYGCRRGSATSEVGGRCNLSSGERLQRRCQPVTFVVAALRTLPALFVMLWAKRVILE